MTAVCDDVKATLVRALIDELATDDTSFVHPVDPAAIKFVSNKTSSSGKWTIAGDETLLVVVVGEVGTGSLLGPYGTLANTEEKARDINKKKVMQMKGRVQLRIPPSVDIDLNPGDKYVAALQNIAMNLNSMQTAREESGEVDLPDDDNDIAVYSFVHRSDEGNFVEMNMATDNMFVTDKNVQAKDLFDNKPSVGNNDDTLATWPDPNFRFSTVSGKRSIRLNSGIQAFDHKGDWVHPSQWANVFTPGTLVEAHVIPLLWDMSKKSPKGAADRLSRTYQLKIAQIRALHPPEPTTGDSDVETSTKTSLKRSNAGEHELSPPKKRAFGKIDYSIAADYAATSGSSPSSSSASSSSAGSSFGPAHADHVTELSNTSATAPAVSSPKKEKGKGKGKAKDVDVTMD